jgi:hypothetical protein
MRSPDWSVSVRQRRAACVLDPVLLLCHASGPALALGLTRVVEPWLTRSFWQLIDASELLLAPRLESGRSPAPQLPGAHWLQPSAQALRDWVAMRDGTDAGSWPLRWVGDCLAESQVQGDAEIDVLDRYEELSDALGRRAAGDGTHRVGAGFDALMTGLDAASLSATLGGAMLLAPAGDASGPWSVQALQQSGVAPQRLDPLPSDSIFAAERTLLRQSVAAAGLSALVECLPPLAVLHVRVDDSAESLPPRTDPGTDGDPWEAARAWWYRV